MSTSFRVSLRCTDCGHKWRWQTRDVEGDDPPCPHCAKQPQTIGLDVAAGQAPAIGGNKAVKAMDYALEAVSQDYHFGDLRTDAREGESMAPKLPPAQQQIADSMFDAQARRKTMSNRMAPKIASMATAAMSGAYRGPVQDPIAHDPIGALHKDRRGTAPVKINYINP